MRSITSLYSLVHDLVSVFFSKWVPHALKIMLLTVLVALSTAGRAITEYKYNAMIKRKTSRFVYGHHRKYYFSRSSAPSSGETPECAICITEFVVGEVGTKLENCGHKFHASCVQRWLVHGNGGNASCPLCRAPVVQEGAAEEHRLKVKSGGGLSRAFEVELGLLLLPGLRYVNWWCCQRSMLGCG